jgi:hypothetical protein
MRFAEQHPSNRYTHNDRTVEAIPLFAFDETVLLNRTLFIFRVINSYNMSNDKGI